MYLVTPLLIVFCCSLPAACSYGDLNGSSLSLSLIIGRQKTSHNLIRGAKRLRLLLISPLYQTFLRSNYGIRTFKL